MKKECPLCGDLISNRGMHSHKNSRRCKSSRTRQNYKNRGMSYTFSKRVANWLKKEGHKVTKDVVGPAACSNGYYHGYYTKKENLELAYRMVMPTNPEDYEQLEKLAETEKYLLVGCVIRKAGGDTPRIYKKLKFGKTRKRKFIRNFARVSSANASLFNRNGIKVATEVRLKTDEIPDEFVSILVLEALA